MSLCCSFSSKAKNVLLPNNSLTRLCYPVQQICVFVLKSVCVCLQEDTVDLRQICLSVSAVSGFRSLESLIHTAFTVSVCVSMGVPCYKLILCIMFVLTEMSIYMTML